MSNRRPSPILAWKPAVMLAASVALLAVGCGKKKEAAKPAPEAKKEAKKADEKAEGAKKGDEAKAGKDDGKMRVFFIDPKEGAIVQGTPDKDGLIEVKVKMGVEGMEVRPAGTKADKTGHHHIIVDSAGIPEGQPVPKDAQHIHFGKGQTEASVKLKAGRRKLTMQFADYAHTSYGPTMSTTIEITVQPSTDAPAPEAAAATLTEDHVPPVAATPPPGPAEAAAQAAAHAAGAKADEAAKKAAGEKASAPTAAK